MTTRKDFIKKVVATRNFLTHCDEELKEKSFTREELPLAYLILTTLFYYQILKLLEFDDKYIARKIKDMNLVIDTAMFYYDLYDSQS